MEAVLAKLEVQQKVTFRNKELAALNAISEIATESSDLDNTLRTILERTTDLLDLDSGVVWLLESDELILRAHCGLSSCFVNHERAVPLGCCLCGTCAETGELVAVDDVAAEPPLANSACAKEGLQCVVCAPVKIGERVMGVIHVASHQRNASALRYRQIVSTVACLVAVAVQHADLREQARRLAVHRDMLSLIGQQVTSVLDLDSLLGKVVTMVREGLGYYHVHILLVDEEAGEVVLKEANGPNAELLKQRGLRLKIGQEGIGGWVAYTGQAMLCNDVSQEPHYYAEELLPETKAELAVPLCFKGRVTAILDVQSDRHDAFDEEDAAFLQTLGGQIAVAIRNAQLFRETRHRCAALIGLHETSLDIISQLDKADVLKALLRRGVQLLGAESSSLCLVDAELGLIHNIANFNTWHDWTGIALRPGEGLVGQVILTGKPLIVDNYQNWPGKVGVFAGDPQIRALGVPLWWQDRAIGGIVVHNDAQSSPFDQNDAWLLSLFADLASIAIKNSELHTQIKKLNRELEQKVEERTKELAAAVRDISAKAEQLRALLARSIGIQAEERARIARDMHDSVIQLITATRYEIQAAKVTVGSGSIAAMKEKLDVARGVLNEMEIEIRNVIYDSHPPILDAVGLVPVLRRHVDDFQEITGIGCCLRVTGVPCRLSPSVEETTFRAVEESLRNVATHAEARNAQVVVAFRSARLSVTVRDDGQGFSYERWAASRDCRHLGLISIQERVESLGGKLEIWPRPGQGTRLKFELPV